MTNHATTSETLSAADTTAVRDVIRRMGIEASAEAVALELARAGIDVSAPEVDRIKADLAAGAAAQSRPSLEPASDWSQHEHTAESANADAQKLVDQTGSPELAKQAIDAVAERQKTGRTEDKKDAFSKQLGFESYLELFEASTPVPSRDGKSWCVTSDRQGQWVVWNDRDLRVQQRFSSREDAVASVAGQA